MMRAEKYISNGELEAYCLGNLDEAAQARLMEMCRIFPVVRLELDVVEQTMVDLAKAMAITPAAACGELHYALSHCMLFKASLAAYDRDNTRSSQHRIFLIEDFKGANCTTVTNLASQVKCKGHVNAAYDV